MKLRVAGSTRRASQQNSRKVEMNDKKRTAEPAPSPLKLLPRSFTTTLAPRLPKKMAYSRPKPPPAPVTTTTWPSYRRSCAMMTVVYSPSSLLFSVRLQVAMQRLFTSCVESPRRQRECQVSPKKPNNKALNLKYDNVICSIKRERMCVCMCMRQDQRSTLSF